MKSSKVYPRVRHVARRPGEWVVVHERPNRPSPTYPSSRSCGGPRRKNADWDLLAIFVIKAIVALVVLGAVISLVQLLLPVIFAVLGVMFIGWMYVLLLR